METNIVSFINKAREKGVVLKKPPPRALESKDSKVVEGVDGDVFTFSFYTERDFIQAHLFESTLRLVFEFFDKETMSKYNEYDIDLESFLIMEQVVDKIEQQMKEINRW